MSEEGVRVYISKPGLDVGVFHHEPYEEWQEHYDTGKAYTDSQLKARDERVARAAFDFAREVHEDTDVELFDSADDYINSEEFRKV